MHAPDGIEPGKILPLDPEHAPFSGRLECAGKAVGAVERDDKARAILTHPVLETAEHRMLNGKAGFLTHFAHDGGKHRLARLHVAARKNDAAADLVLHEDPAAVADHAEVGKLNKACTAHVFASPRSRIVINSSPVIVSFS